MSGRFFSRSIKRAAYERAGGFCECGCGGPLSIGRIRYNHRIPWKTSRDSSLSNCQVLRVECDRVITYTRDIPQLAKSERVRDRHLGIIRPGMGPRPLPGGRNDRLKKTIRGEVVDRRTGEWL
jgi:hypothetical protein